MKKVGTTIIIAVMSIYTFAQAPAWLGAQSVGGIQAEYQISSVTDGFGNLIITGDFMSPTIAFAADTLTNAGALDIFIVKYDPSGAMLWAKSIGGTQDELVTLVTTDNLGNVIVTGCFHSATLTIGNITLTNAGITYYRDVFIVKYDPAGNVIWAKSAGGSINDSGQGVTADNLGNIIFGGSFSSSAITFDTITLTNSNTGSGSISMFIVKYDSVGNVLWAKTANGKGYVQSLVCDSTGNINVVGWSYGTMTFDSVVLYNLGNSDMFIAKYNTSGNVLWAKSAGGSLIDEVTSLSIDVPGNLIVTRKFNSPTIVFDTIALSNAGDYDIFIAKYDSSGNVLWAKSEGGTSLDESRTVTVDALGNLIFGGNFKSSIINFSTDTLSPTTPGHSDILIVKYAPDGTELWAKSDGGNNNSWVKKHYK